MPRRTAALISLGCAKNLSDSEDLVTALKSVGFGLTRELAAADLILVNTCGFIEGAKKESIAHILDAVRDRKPGAKVFVAGCLTERYRAELARDIPEVDAWVAFADYDRFPAVVRRHFPGVAVHRLRHDQRSQLTPGHYAFLKIAEGCDNTCNFCAIPLIRGRHVSRPQAELVRQARLYAERGVKEISLISQQLDYYGRDLGDGHHLSGLIRAIAAAAPEAWIRLHYLYPNDLGDELVATIAGTANVVKYIDMPIQHAADRMLALMGRRTTRRHIAARLAALRAAMPEVVLRTTCLVGFPGEREEDVEELLGFLREQRFDAVGCFPYSDEEGTTAAKMPRKIPPATIRARHRRVMAEQRKLHRSQARRWLGRQLRVLVDEQRDFGVFACRHAGQAHEVDAVTLVAAERLAVGDWATVRITALRGYDLVGELL